MHLLLNSAHFFLAVLACQLRTSFSLSFLHSLYTSRNVRTWIKVELRGENAYSVRFKKKVGKSV